MIQFHDVKPADTGSVPGIDDREDLLDICPDRGCPKWAAARFTTFFLVVLALIIGAALGRLAGGPSAGPPRAPGLPTGSPVARSDAQGCPDDRHCRTYDLTVPLLLQLLKDDFPDLRANSLLAIEDTLTAQQYRLSLEATLSRGLTLRITAQQAAGQPPLTTPWTLVAVGDDARPDHAERVITNNKASGVVVGIRLLRTAVQRLGRSDFRCDWCQPSRPTAAVEHALDLLVTRPQSRMWAMIGIGIQTAVHSNAIAWLN